MFLDSTKHMLLCFFDWLQKHFAKSMSLGSPNKGSKCEEGKILAYKKNKVGLILISILFKRILMRIVLLGLKLMQVTFYQCFDRLLCS